ncbi:RdgB/HAM1 family non-canonical purine NTP pyrophosphatase [Ignatzschineria rhizosphaerae]|uniref:dITP/XTP pyrophosphatase n=1 Tax=Ignatzschineria rhizosphaerae TaxID=2923279 RepID=A0ABY3WYW4_9GAMM|nr:RdgB/HAM1 family non-canonical purine NTP pyrophosphatase [Ignatzschineria rhizosphaerae]UNM95801.1 RdgB/HAM1 family non-canonical purine NTP pyrophosphatase [Ignatzschineria rhizosphaerae]
MKKIVIASNNAGKIAEFKALFEPLGIETLSLKEAGIISDPEETGLTFIENALIKARNAAKISGLPALADDSGLVVPHLNGEPGIYSARYSEEATDSANNAKLLQKMSNFQDQERAAYFKAVLVLVRDETDPVPLIAEGEAHGFITKEILGSGGFGYDPLFYFPDKSQTFGELSSEEKNQISHRAIALQKLSTKLNTL